MEGLIGCEINQVRLIFFTAPLGLGALLCHLRLVLVMGFLLPARRKVFGDASPGLFAPRANLLADVSPVMNLLKLYEIHNPRAMTPLNMPCHAVQTTHRRNDAVWTLEGCPGNFENLQFLGRATNRAG
jgi:hypothetical protein